jgi:hypothetical protein
VNVCALSGVGGHLSIMHARIEVEKAREGARAGHRMTAAHFPSRGTHG